MDALDAARSRLGKVGDDSLVAAREPVDIRVVRGLVY
jgi:hypothetical protein